MRIRTFIVAALVVNLALLAGVIYQISSPARVVEAKQDAVDAATSPELLTTNIQLRVVSVPSSAQKETFRWDDIESNDYLQLAENLRGIGCPADTVRDIVVGRAEDDYADQLWMLQKPMQAALWDYVAKGIEIDDWPLDQTMVTNMEELLSRRRETMKVLNSTLGERLESVEMPESELWGFLTSEQRVEVRRVYEKYTELRSAMMKRLNEQGLDRDERKKLTEQVKGLNSEKEAELIALVGEDGYAEYRARSSINARRLHSTPGLIATEEELREIARRQDEFDRQRKAVPRSDPDSNRKWNELKAAHAAVYPEVLGTNRWQESLLSRNRDYLNFRNIVWRHGLPVDIAGRLNDVKQVAEKNARDLMASEVSDPELRAQAAKAILLNTQAEIMGVVGEQAWPTMQKYGMSWYDKLFEEDSNGQ